ncbi:DUF983 domain-containing protein [Foetidibacter luteolus]|uniref:DUF983 domain-containing protein n=1 Tax=Foetidibacter luteolus TaxID=2608880 RepID=UPI00129A5A5D|nr:DUF983 domain-containing protein [Foetidibacter luteolus]
MKPITTPVHHGAGRLLLCKCPRCRQGDMFTVNNPYKLKTFMQMNETCNVCGQEFDIEVGFYYGSSYISYALTVALSAFTFAAWWFTIGFSLYDNRVFYWLGLNAFFLLMLQPVLMRLARTLWLALFVRYDRNWKQHPARKPERQNEALKNAW